MKKTLQLGLGVLMILLCLTAPANPNQKLPPKLLHLALTGYRIAQSHHLLHRTKLIIVDFSLPSYVKRLWVYDVATRQVVLNTFVAHGQGSGLTFARSFSNQAKSHASALGFYVTDTSYYGGHGYSLKLRGLEPGYNDHAKARGIVVHPAFYVAESYITNHHRAGRSWGCFALAPIINKNFIDLTKNGALLMAFSNNKQWLDHSRFLQV